MSKGRGNTLLFRNCQGGEAIPTMAELISTYKLLTVWIPAGIFLDSLFQSLPIQCWYHLVGCALHNYVLTSVMQTSIMLRNTICPQRYTVLAVALFHTGVSRAQPVHASSNKAKAESLTETEARGSWVWGASRALSTACNTKEAKAKSESKTVIVTSRTTSCCFGARRRLQHLANVCKPQVLPLFIHTWSSALPSLWHK